MTSLARHRLIKSHCCVGGSRIRNLLLMKRRYDRPITKPFQFHHHARLFKHVLYTKKDSNLHRGHFFRYAYLLADSNCEPDASVRLPVPPLVYYCWKLIYLTFQCFVHGLGIEMNIVSCVDSSITHH